MKRELKRQQTQQLLLNTTIELIREKGCEKTTFSDIMERSGLSKGAIFHYVKSKEELLAMVLQQSLEETNSRFYQGVADANQEFAGPMSGISQNLPALEDSQNVTNQVFMYLLGKSDESAVKEITKFYEHVLQVSRQWIEEGQKHGVIPQTVDAGKTADLFVLISMGLRVRGFIQTDSAAFRAEDFTELITRLLQPRS
ncbi:TetR/AcrR family transcriptional regulator [Paenibacillus sp. NPDC056579]|uniref:TetR/AcrR family transcriptional regulator n=1 Tax=Paenibacillus sp. NPDC056579 TaxID=3345871 RepID=UPI0036BE3261